MSLILCPECSQQISNTAPTCPHCGFNNSHQQKKPKISSTDAITGIFVLGFLGWLFWPSTPNINQSSTPPANHVAQAAAAPAPQPTPEEIAVKAREDIRDERVIKTALYIKKRLRDPDSLVWEVFQSNDTGDLLCISYRARNGFGGMDREQAVVVGTKISKTPSNIKKHCSSGAASTNVKDYVNAVLPAL